MKTIWIASYPKSGNTWLRAFLMQLLWGEERSLTLADLGTYFASTTGRQWYDLAFGGDTSGLDASALLRLRHRALELMSEQSPNMVFVKTHAPLAAWGQATTQHLIPPDLTRGALYIVRNPLDIVPSAARHYGVSLDAMIDLMASDTFASDNTAAHVPERIGPWHAHLSRWIEGTDKPPQPGQQIPQVVRYEDMYTDTVNTFGLVTRYLGIKVPRARLNRAIRRSSFGVLQQQEAASGFAERSTHTDRFFNHGKPGSGAAQLSKAQIDRIIETQGKLMRRCGYSTDLDGHS
ncbi:sulfotransferase domain-containing protein [Pyruvatibacter sp.]|uniref:sulfotransferase domain-containing protein n=1 Tax=Pyruvatibacter sp. TaxID=1981328 RepID=UPI0032ECBDD3